MSTSPPTSGTFGRAPYARPVADQLVSTCVWRLTPELVVALDERFGEPTDAYVNGSQVWLRDDGPGGATVEWRLHPVPGYERPPATATIEVFPTVALAVARGEEPIRPPEALWEGLEAFPAFGDEVEPATLAAAASDVLGVVPDAAGLADHERIADDWERTAGATSIIHALLDQLGAPPT